MLVNEMKTHVIFHIFYVIVFCKLGAIRDIFLFSRECISLRFLEET